VLPENEHFCDNSDSKILKLLNFLDMPHSCTLRGNQDINVSVLSTCRQKTISPWSHTRNRMQTPKIKIINVSQASSTHKSCVDGKHSHLDLTHAIGCKHPRLKPRHCPVPTFCRVGLALTSTSCCLHQAIYSTCYGLLQNVTGSPW
jgi:hypothetical protein